MQEKLNQEQFQYVKMMRELQNLVDIHAVLNDPETREILQDIYNITEKEKRIIPHHDELKMLSKQRGEKFNTILNDNPSLSKAIKVLFRYILDGTLKMKPHHKQKLKPHKHYIRKIANKPQGKLIVQKGGSILATIFSTIVPLIPAIL